MDAGDPGHTAWFQSRVQVLVRSLRSHPQWSNRLREEEDSSPSSPPPQRRPLQLGRSLASRWQQYSPAPLRRLKRLFSVSSERQLSEQDEGWESDNDDLRKQQQRLKAAGAEGSTSLSDTSPLLHSESPIATTSADVESDIRGQDREGIGSLASVHQKTFFEEWGTSEHSQEVRKSHSIKDPPDIPGDLHSEEDIHSKQLIPSPARLPSPYDVEEAAANVVGSSYKVLHSTSNSSDFSKDYYVLTTDTDTEEDGERVNGECQQTEMTQWRQVDNDTRVVNGEKTPVNERTTSDTELASTGLSQVKSESLTSLLNGKLDEEVACLLSSEFIEESASVIEIKVSEESANADVVSVDMAQNVDEESSQKLDDSVCDKEGMAVIGVVTKSELETCGVDETDQAAMSPPSIVLDIPQTIDQISPSSEMTTEIANTITASDSQGPHRPPKLQLHITASPSSQSAARKSPVTVQEWVDSLPLHHRTEEEGGEEPPLEESDDHLDLGLGAEAGLLYDALPAVTVVSPAEPTPTPGSVGKATPMSAARLAREPSVQSDVTSHTGSHCSSVESYLESRRPDPEEVLLSLGFGGSKGIAGSVDSEVSRIPRRFLQPSKVKGVAIDDFLRYQQDLIETFESGFCGYRGLTGPSHTVPSVIVAKIMEKLRERERENIPPGSVSSAPVIGNSTPNPPPTAAGKFSRAARKVLTRTAVLGALPAVRQQQQQSVLTPDNRRFLDNQGSKSPEIPRKRMIIGHRSFTFSCDGDLIELDPLTPTTPTGNHEPKPKPLLHKDSVLSTATSMSLTSVDSDSDTDDHSGSFSAQNKRNLALDHQTSSPPKSLHFSTPNNSEDSDIHHSQKIYPPFSPVSKRMSSTSISSWESEAISPINSFAGMRHQSIDEVPLVPSDHDEEGSKMVVKRSNRCHSSPDSPLSTSWPMRYESIDEDAEMKSDQSASLLSTSNSEHSHDISSTSDGQDHNLKQQLELRLDHSLKTHEPSVEHKLTGEVNGSETERLSEFSVSSGEAKTTKTLEQQIQIQKNVISLLQLRRSSLKRQQRILDEDEPVDLAEQDNNSDMRDIHNSIGRGPQHENAQMQDVKRKSEEEHFEDSDVFMDSTPVYETVDLGVLGGKNENSEPKQSEDKNVELYEQRTVLPIESRKIADITVEQTEIQLTKCEEISVEPESTKLEPDLLRVVNTDMKADSFEMEEINTCGEDEVVGLAVLSRARSDSSGFLDGDSETFPFRTVINESTTDVAIESSQRDVSNNEKSTVPQFEVSNFTTSDINNSLTPKSENKLETSSNTASLALDVKISLSAIKDRSLPNNLLDEQSNVKKWMENNDFTKVSIDKSVTELSSAIGENNRKPLENNLLAELNESRMLTEKSPYNVSTPSKSSVFGESAISPLIQDFPFVYRTSPSTPTSPHHLSVNVDDKELVRQRTMSLRGPEDKSTPTLANVRRVKSAPHCLEHLSSKDELVRGSSWSSYSNMFSFCSDESVIHVGLQKSGLNRGSDRRLSDVGDGTFKSESATQNDSNKEHKTTNIPEFLSSQYLKPSSVPYGRGARRSASDPSSVSGRNVKDLQELVGELADRGWDITMGTDSSPFACQSEHQLLRLQGDAVRAGLAAYGRQLVGGQQADMQNGSHEVAEACKEMQAVREVRDRIAAELRRVADLLEEQPPHRVADITGQMAVLLREQTRLCRQLEALSCDSSPSIFVEPAPCCSVLEAVREENRHLQTLVERNSQELVEIRQLLKELVAVKKS